MRFIKLSNGTLINLDQVSTIEGTVIYLANRTLTVSKEECDRILSLLDKVVSQ